MWGLPIAFEDIVKDCVNSRRLKAHSAQVHQVEHATFCRVEYY